MQNKNITLLNLHAGLQRYASKTLDVFGGIYFLTHGVSFLLVALMWAASFFIRFLLRPLSVWFSDVVGLKWALIVGTAATSGLFLIFNKVNGLDVWLAVFAVYLAFYDILYWLPYHALYAVSGEEDLRGKHVAHGVGFVSTIQIVMPFIGALLATKFGFGYLYASAMFAMMLSITPILFTKNLSPGIKMNFGEAWKEIDKRGLVMSIGNGLMENGHNFIWTIVMFTVVGGLVDFGGLVTVELLSTAIISLVVGHHIDKGRAGWAVKAGLVTMAFVMIARSFLVTTTAQVIGINFIASLGGALLSMAYTVSLYNFAQRSHNVLWFHFFAEAGWDIGGAISMLVAAGLFAIGVSLQHIMLIGLAGIVVIDRVLGRS